MKQILALLKKDILIEFRLKEALSLLIFLSLLLSICVSVGIQSAFLEPQSIEKLFSPMVWVIFILSSSVVVGRTSEYDLANRSIDALLLTGVSPQKLFFAKTVSNFLLTLLAQTTTLLVLALLLNADIGEDIGALLLLSCGVVFAYSSLATLLSGVSASSKLRGMLLPMILLPLLFPLLFCAVEMTAEIAFGSGLGIESPWLSLLIGLDVVYFTAGLNLYEYVVRE